MIALTYDGIALTSQRIAPGDTATQIGASIYKYVEKKLLFDSGGTDAITAGMRILGNTSAAVGIVLSVSALTGGSWAGGDAAGYVILGSVVGTFQNDETLTIDATADAATVNGTLVTLSKDQYVHPEYYGLTARQLWIQAEDNNLRVSIAGEIATQTSKMGLVLYTGSSMPITDAGNMAAAYVIDAVSGSVGYANIVGLF